MISKKEFSKKVSSQIFEIIKKSQRILLHCHVSPDEDSVGSVLAMYHFLSGLGKKVTLISGDSDFLENVSFLPGFEKIEKKNFFEVDLSDFDLFIILDSASLKMISRLGEIIFPPHLKTIVIDHHDSNEGFADINLIDVSSVATCQVIFNLFKEWKVKITPEVAACLLAGIYADSGGFQYDKTNLKTLEAAYFLAKLYPDFRKVFKATRRSLSREMLRLKALAYNNLEIFFDGKVVFSLINLKSLKEVGLYKKISFFNGLSQDFLLVPEWKVVVILIEKEKSLVDVSLRAQEEAGFDVSKIALTLGGGGHKLVAGATVKKSLKETKRLILKTFNELYPWLQKSN